ncbi:hypothetical protein REMIM1_CH00838 [Rhizobium etli bv. mimosae str. Mim1]|nr:hypothetical protein REMIM1_CH00838 [Rhizobium etli bv. mimosae str. Mim1]
MRLLRHMLGKHKKQAYAAAGLMPAPMPAIIAAATPVSEQEPFETDYSGIAFRARLTAKSSPARFNCSADL